MTNTEVKDLEHCVTKTINLTDTLSSISLLLNYYAKTYEQMNVDGIYGLRVMEDQLFAILDAVPNHGVRLDLSKQVVTDLEELYSRASSIIDKSKRAVQQSDPTYYQKMGQIIEKPVQMVHAYKLVDRTLQWQETQANTVGFNESFSDRCMGELMGVGFTEDRCSPSATCLNVMFAPGHQDYFLTHQLLYIQLAKQYRCEQTLNTHLKTRGTKQLKDYELEFCSNNFLEIMELVSKLPAGQQIPVVYQDLFMEQQFVCPMFGYMQFLHFDWLKQILSWQHPSGCFGSPIESPVEQQQEVRREPPAAERVRRDDGVVMPDGVSNKLVLVDGNSNDSVKRVGRRLLEERALADGCMAHETAVAACALSQYLKYQILQYPDEYSKLVQLDGINFLLPRNIDLLPVYREFAQPQQRPLLEQNAPDLGSDQSLVRNSDHEQVRDAADGILAKRSRDRDGADYVKRSRDRDEAYNADIAFDKARQEDDADVDDNDEDEEDDDDYDDDAEPNGGAYEQDADDAQYYDAAGDIQPRHKQHERRREVDAAGPRHYAQRPDWPRERREGDAGDDDVMQFYDDGVANGQGDDDDDEEEGDPDYDDDNGDVMDAARAHAAAYDNGEDDVNPRFRAALNPDYDGDGDAPAAGFVQERNDDDDQQYSYDETLDSAHKQLQQLHAPGAAAAEPAHVIGRRTTLHSLNAAARDAFYDGDAANAPAHSANDVKPMEAPLQPLSVGVNYLVTVACVAVLLLFMFKFIRARRVIIRYKYG